MTELIRGLYNILPKHKGGVITIGNFDGVHAGHKSLIKKIKEYAKVHQVPSIVITFEPQPLEFFAKQKGNSSRVTARLTRWREKYAALAEMGLDYVLVLRFDQKLANLSAEEFINEVLLKGLAVKHVIVGDDFHFGRNREGNFTYLKEAGLAKGFTLEAMDSVTFAGERVSSTRIRQALAFGDHATAELLLGRPYSMMGRVGHGNKLGRQLGFPTANIYLHRVVTPIQGIYVVRMYGIEKEGLPGVANVGIRPTIGGTRTLLEVYLFDFNRDIYGKHVTVEFYKKLRNEAYFPNLESLRDAIAKDVEEARTYFK